MPLWHLRRAPARFALNPVARDCAQRPRRAVPVVFVASLG